jgi:hypothetical protein
MCRSIKTLRQGAQPASDEEIHAAALQYVRKVSGYRAPSAANVDAFATAIDEDGSPAVILGNWEENFRQIAMTKPTRS